VRRGGFRQRISLRPCALRCVLRSCALCLALRSALLRPVPCAALCARHSRLRYRPWLRSRALTSSFSVESLRPALHIIGLTRSVGPILCLAFTTFSQNIHLFAHFPALDCRTSGSSVQICSSRCRTSGSSVHTLSECSVRPILPMPFRHDSARHLVKC
jgi:hypothetical protein